MILVQTPAGTLRILKNLSCPDIPGIDIYVDDRLIAVIEYQGKGHAPGIDAHIYKSDSPDGPDVSVRIPLSTLNHQPSTRRPT